MDLVIVKRIRAANPFYNSQFKQISIHNQEFCDILKVSKIYLSKDVKELNQWKKTRISSVDLYSNELAQALLEVSNYKLEAIVAHQIARQSANQVDFDDPNLMHVGVNSIANIIMHNIKPEYLQII
ncbi:hypothetical protein [Streptococcus sp. NLN76]|uniref:hypothetical protein n=1 Tax=Streptococcus sp. NLN76 TaxID=2822800 RepID=UPI001B3571E4|nr:hypothetical protein [Streptococcus sp. NLN76]